MGSRRLAHHPDLPLPVLLCPIRTARRMRLRYDDKRQLLKVTHPPRLSAKLALAWAADQKSWVAEQMQATPSPEPFDPGAVIPILGQDTRLLWREDAPRSPQLSDGALLLGGPKGGFERRVQSFLRKLALEVLSRDTTEFATLAGEKPISVSVGDAATRWGSCSSGRKIRFSWRLILAPPDARRYVVAHEVAHLRHLDHGAEFKAFERQLFGGDVAAAQALLRRLGPRLKRIGLRG